PTPHPVEAEDRAVLARLRQDPLVQGDDEEHRVDRADSGEHVADEVLMAGDVDDADVRAAGRTEPREPEVDGHAPLALLAQAIGVDASERGDEGRLPVVHVAGGADDPDRPLGGHSAGTVHSAKSAGTTTRASSSIPAIQMPSTMPVARIGSGERSRLTAWWRCTRSRPAAHAAAPRCRSSS